MSDKFEFDDVFSKGESGQNDETTTEPESEGTGFSFPKPPIRKTDENQCTYHFAGDPNAEKEPAEKNSRYFDIIGEEPEEPVKAEEAFNPYAPDSGEGSGYEAQNNSYNEVPRQTYNYVNPQYASVPVTEEPPKKSKGKKVAFGLVILCVIVGVALIIGSFFKNADKVVTVPHTSESTESTAPDETLSPEISTTNPTNIEQINSVWVAEKVRPSVVGVMTYVDGQLAGEGSGVLWMEKGGYTYVITCAHVIDAKGVTFGVLLLDGRSFEATLVGADTRTDIGVIKIKANGLPLAELGNSASLKIGEPVYAIGNPGGSEYFGSLTDGIVSAIDRSVTATYKMTCIQHNAAINPGNSGGALVNTAGQIVGINSSKIASTEYEGMGFAVPTAIAKPVAEALVKHGYVPNRPKLGIEYAPVSAYQLYSMVVSIKGLPQGSLVIAGISSDSSLRETEAEVGDLIIAVNGKDMNDSSVLLDLIETGAVGDSLTLTLCRIESRTYKTSTFDVTITLVEDKGKTEEETTTQSYNEDGYYYGGASDFEDFFNRYFGW